MNTNTPENADEASKDTGKRKDQEDLNSDTSSSSDDELKWEQSDTVSNACK